MTDFRPGPMAGTVAATSTPHGPVRRVLRTCMRIGHWIPGFSWVLVAYILIATYVTDVRQPFFSFLTYQLSAVEVLYALTGLVMVLELLRVSKPGIDNTWEAISMAVILVISIVLFALASVGTLGLKMFATSEFLIITILSLFQVIVAFLINARTLKRTIDYSGGEG